MLSVVGLAIVIIIASSLIFFLRPSVIPGPADHTVQIPIRINNDIEMSQTASNYEWTGDGSLQHPYLIQDIVMNTSSDAPCIYIGNTTSNIRITNCSVTGVYDDIFDVGEYVIGQGISLTNLENVSIDRCTILNCSIGVSISSCSNISVRNTSITDLTREFSFGPIEILLNRSNHVTFADNTLRGVTSFRLDNSSHNIIINNRCDRFESFFSSDNLVKNNSITHRSSAFYMLSSNRNVIEGNGIGALFNQVTAINTTGNVFRNNYLHSIYDRATFVNANNMLFENNTVSTFTPSGSMLVESVNGCTFINNRFDDQFYLTNSSGSRIIGNWFNCTPTIYGPILSLVGGAGNQINGNFIFGGNNSLWMANSDSNFVSGNAFANASGHGIFLAQSDNNTLTRNQISDCNILGYRYYPGNIQGYDDTGSNAWNDTFGGNYWSDRTLGSGSYQLDGGQDAADRLPLDVPLPMSRYLGPAL